MLLDKTCTWIFFYLSFYFFLTIFLYSFVVSIFLSFSFFVLFIGCRWVGGKRWGIRLSFYFLFTYLYWKKGRKDTIVSGGDSKESWLRGGEEWREKEMYILFFLYISGRYHKQTLSCRHLFCLNFHIFHISVSPHSSVFPCIVSFFPLLFIFYFD